ncbi:mCG1038760, partial [Mus musculus]
YLRGLTTVPFRYTKFKMPIKNWKGKCCVGFGSSSLHHRLEVKLQVHGEHLKL